MQVETFIDASSYLKLDEEFYHRSDPQALEDPYIIHINEEIGELLFAEDFEKQSPQLFDLLSGNFTSQTLTYFSMCYAGHQFGHYLPRLGDGRVHHIGCIDKWHLQLKGSGETLYARMADGRATIHSSVREYLMSEAMFHLGVPTSRALGVVGSKTKIVRGFIEYAAMTTRVASSWVRFGSFEYFYYTKSHTKLRDLAEYVIEESYSHLKEDDDRFYKLFCAIVEKTARLIAKWQAIGFCHGVMNTDNMSIAGLTIDYGPFAMMDEFQYGYVCNHTDKIGRYSYGEQPNVAYWNLTMLAKTFSPLVDMKRLQAKLDDYGSLIYPNAYVREMRNKLGLERKLEEDMELIKELVGALQDAQVDYTLFFRTLSHYDGDRATLYDIVMEPVVIDNWLQLYDKRLSKESKTAMERNEMMLHSNPKYVLKNYMLQEAIDRVLQGDFSGVEKMLYIAKHAFEELPEYEHYAGDTPEAYKNIGLSCSS